MPGLDTTIASSVAASVASSVAAAHAASIATTTTIAGFKRGQHERQDVCRLHDRRGPLGQRVVLGCGGVEGVL